MTTRREALAIVGISVLGACSGTQHGGTSDTPVWLAVVETIVSTAGAIEPLACGALVLTMPGSAPACALVGSSLSLLGDAIEAYRSAQGQPNALCALRSAMDSALSARLDVQRLLEGAGVHAASSAVSAIAGMLSLALDSIVPPCHPMPSVAAMQRLRAVYQAGR